MASSEYEPGMIRVYRVEHEATRYQALQPARAEDAPLLIGSCRKRAATWVPPDVTITQPWLEEGDFYQPNNSVLIARPDPGPDIENLFEWSGETLPLPWQGREYPLLNVTECWNCLNREESEWEYAADGVTRLYPTRYVFHRHRLDASPLFKIPETYTYEILALDSPFLETEDVLSLTRRLGLRGLRFTLLWEVPE